MVKSCKSTQFRNPVTGRCNNIVNKARVCKASKVRRPDGRCVKKCISGKKHVLNKAGKFVCRKPTCKKGKKKNSAGRCVYKTMPCKDPRKRRSKRTGRCVFKRSKVSREVSGAERYLYEKRLKKAFLSQIKTLPKSSPERKAKQASYYAKRRVSRKRYRRSRVASAKKKKAASIAKRKALKAELRNRASTPSLAAKRARAAYARQQRFELNQPLNYFRDGMIVEI
jgi:hypothetical protein